MSDKTKNIDNLKEIKTPPPKKKKLIFVEPGDKKFDKIIEDVTKQKTDTSEQKDK